MWMAEGHSRSLWEHTSNVIAAIFNSQRQSDDDPICDPINVLPDWMRPKSRPEPEEHRNCSLVTSNLDFLKQYCKNTKEA